MKIRTIDQQEAHYKRWAWLLLRISDYDLEEGVAVIPKWYRLSYLETTRAVRVFSPIGLHLIVRGWECRSWLWWSWYYYFTWGDHTWNIRHGR